jgi:peroxiredoxin
MARVGDRAPPIVLENATGVTVDVGTLLKNGPVIVTFYRGGWCPKEPTMVPVRPS